jgi:hypothetical protein
MQISAEAVAAVSAAQGRDERPAVPFAQSAEYATWQAQTAQRRTMDLEVLSQVEKRRNG